MLQFLRTSAGLSRRAARKSALALRRLGIETLETRELLSAAAGFLQQPTPVPRVSALAPVVANDDFGNTFATASAITLAANGTASRSGRIERSGDVDMFRFVARLSGQVTIRQSAAVASALDSNLYVYGPKQSLLATNDDSAGTLNSRVIINAIAGSTYYIKAAGLGTSTGAYVVQISTVATRADDVPNTFGLAKAVSLTAAGAASQTGRIDYARDVDMFRIVAPLTGRMTVTQTAATGSYLDSFVHVYDATQKLIVENDDSGAAQDSRVDFNVTAGKTYYIDAAAYDVSTGVYVLRFATTATTPTPTPAPTPTPTPTPSTGAFHIDLNITGMSAAQQQIVAQAAARWEQVIVGDLPPIPYAGGVIDDLRINISAVAMDGIGGVLGETSVDGQRPASRLPYLATLQLDSADVVDMQAHGNLLGVLEHEMGHALGIGTVWEDLNLLAGANTANPRFTGTRATAEYNRIFGAAATGVPVEATGGGGTALSHWRESILGNEMMTGWYDEGQLNPLSSITIASLADMGYQVNMAAADVYAPSAAVRAASAAMSTTSTMANDLAWLPQSDNTAAQRRRATDLVFAAVGARVRL